MMEKPKPSQDQAAETAEGIKPQMSKGEQWYDSLLYTGVNYWANLGISLVVTDYFMHGKGKSFFKNGVESWTKGLMSSTGMGRPNAKWLSEIALGTFSLNSGGNILLIPTKFAEDNKRNIVHWLNDKLGVDQTAPDGHKMTPDEIYIECEQEKQSWGRMITRRLMGWGATTTVGLTLDRVMAKKLPHPITVEGEIKTHKPGQAVFTDMVVDGTSYGLKNFVPGGKAIADNPMAQRYMGYAALDWIYTLITSAILHKTNGAHKEKKEHEIEPVLAPALPGADIQNEEVAAETKPHNHAAKLASHEMRNHGYAASLMQQQEAAGREGMSL